jgi:hypothetical protein
MVVQAEKPGSQQGSTRVIPAFDAFVYFESVSPMFRRSRNLATISAPGAVSGRNGPAHDRCIATVSQRGP